MIGANLGPLFEQAEADRLKPQTAAVLRMLNERGSVTPMEALREVGTDRLAARIYELRQAGYDVRKRMEANADGKGHHARYYMNREEQAA